MSTPVLKQAGDRTLLDRNAGAEADLGDIPRTDVAAKVDAWNDDPIDIDLDVDANLEVVDDLLDTSDQAWVLGSFTGPGPNFRERLAEGAAPLTSPGCRLEVGVQKLFSRDDTSRHG